MLSSAFSILNQADLSYNSDSMATTLIHTLANVARYPLYQQKIFAELQSISSVADFAAVMKLQVLKSVIMETLRLWPPIPTGPGRIVPRGGLTIAGKYIPAGTTIFAPRYTISRCKSWSSLSTYEELLTSWEISRRLVRPRNRVCSRAVDHEARDGQR